MQCPKCGEAMNHHADKVVEPTTDAERASVDPAFGGVLRETHACRACGNIEFRPAARKA